MKRSLIGLGLLGLLAFAGTASADVLAQDSAANYTAETFVNGANGGFGFGAWEFKNAAPTLADSTAGVCGDINSENGLSFRFARDEIDGEPHYGYCNGYRDFNALNPGDVLTFRFTCAWCAGGRGLDLFANGGHEESDKVANVIHLSGDNLFSVNGVVIADNWAPQAVTEVTIVQKADGIDLSLKRTSVSTEPVVEDLEYSTNIVTSAKLTGIGLYAGGWDWNEGENVENYAFYVNDLMIEGVPPTDQLELKGQWDVTSASAELPFTVVRTKSEGDLDVALSSSYPEFASVPNLVTFADGETEVSFTVAATLQGRGNVATISASADGVAGNSFDVKGPDYRVNNGSDVPVSFRTGESADIWINWDGGARDDSKLVLAADPEGVISVPDGWTLPDEGDVYVQSSVSALAAGDADLILSFDGVEMARCKFSVLALGFELSGNTAPKTDATVTYTLKATLDGSEEGCSVSVDPADGVTVDPASFDLVEHAEDGFYYRDIEVTFATAGDYTVSVASPNYSASIGVSVSEPADFSDYIAYDDASLYGGSFDFASTGEGSDGFQPWTVWKADAQYGSAIVTDADGGFPAILSDGSALAIYANGENPAYAIVRPFVNDLQPGQKASIEFVAPQEGGYRKIYFSRIWEGTPYNRFQVWASGGKVGVTVEDGDDTELSWSENSRRIVASVELAADGSSYTLSLAGYNEGSEFADDVFQYSIGSDVGSWGDGIQGIAIDGWDLPNDFLFNRLAIEQVEDPIEPPPPAVTMEWTAGVWNPDEVGVPYTFGLKSSEDGAIGLVDLSVEPAEGIELSTAQIDLSEGEATFTVTLTGETLPAGTAFTITAKAQAEGVDDATYGLTATEPYCTIDPQFATFDYVSGGTVEFSIFGTPSRVGVTVDLDSDNEGILMPPSPATAVVGGTFTYTMPGLEEGETYIHARYEGAEWGYAGITINGKAGDDPYEKVLPVTAMAIEDGSMKLTVDGQAATVYGATEIKDGNWDWQAMELAIEEDSITIPMGVPFLVIKVEK